MAVSCSTAFWSCPVPNYGTFQKRTGELLHTLPFAFVQYNSLWHCRGILAYGVLYAQACRFSRLSDLSTFPDRSYRALRTNSAYYGTVRLESHKFSAANRCRKVCPNLITECCLIVKWIWNNQELVDDWPKRPFSHHTNNRCDYTILCRSVVVA
jgi:hypothetical protein